MPSEPDMIEWFRRQLKNLEVSSKRESDSALMQNEARHEDLFHQFQPSADYSMPAFGLSGNEQANVHSPEVPLTEVSPIEGVSSKEKISGIQALPITNIDVAHSAIMRVGIDRGFDTLIYGNYLNIIEMPSKPSSDQMMLRISLNERLKKFWKKFIGIESIDKAGRKFVPGPISLEDVLYFLVATSGFKQLQDVIKKQEKEGGTTTYILEFDYLGIVIKIVSSYMGIWYGPIKRTEVNRIPDPFGPGSIEVITSYADEFEVTYYACTVISITRANIRWKCTNGGSGLINGPEIATMQVANIPDLETAVPTGREVIVQQERKEKVF